MIPSRVNRALIPVAALALAGWTIGGLAGPAATAATAAPAARNGMPAAAGPGQPAPADPCVATAAASPAAQQATSGASRTGARSLTIRGLARPYTSEADTYCGTLKLPGKPRLQPLAIEINGKVAATTQAGLDRSWHADITVTGTKTQVIRAVWHPGKRDQLRSKPLTIHPTAAADTRPTGPQLIAAALHKHRISHQTALVDDVLALFDPGRLAPSLRGVKPVAELSDAGLLAAVEDGWNTLSSSQRAEVRPYLGPFPFARHQSASPQAGGRPAEVCGRPVLGFGGIPGLTVIVPPFGPTVPAGWAFIGTTHFKFWYVTKNIPYTTAVESKASAELLAAEAEKIWNAETGLFGRTPPTDASQPCNGGDGRIDVYVYFKTFKTYALTFGFDLGTCQHDPAWMFINPGFANTPQYAQYVLAHEFFHTLEIGSYSLPGSCLSHDWIGEATATWVVDYVYPSNNLEQHNADTYFASDYAHVLAAGDFNTGYEDYIFLFFLARQFDPTVIRDVWNNAEHEPPLQALNSATPGGLIEHWHEFALDNWNRPPLDNYTAWDHIPYQLSNQPFVRINLGGKHAKDFPLRAASSGPIAVFSLSSNYLYIPITDPKISHLTFTKYGYSKLAPGLRIDALIEMEDGTFEEQDWTSGADHSFCRDKDNQDVASVLLMASNGSLKDGGNFLQPGAKVSASDACVPDGYRGTVTDTQTIKSAAQDTVQASTATVKLAFDKTDSTPALGQFVYNSTGGTVKLSVSGTTGPCSVSGSGSFAIAAWTPPVLSGPGAQIMAGSGISPGSPYVGNGAFTGSPSIPETITCPTGSAKGPYFGSGQWWMTSPNGQQTAKIGTDQDLLGTLKTTSPGGLTQIWTWNLIPIFTS